MFWCKKTFSYWVIGLFDYLRLYPSFIRFLKTCCTELLMTLTLSPIFWSRKRDWKLLKDRLPSLFSVYEFDLSIPMRKFFYLRVLLDAGTIDDVFLPRCPMPISKHRNEFSVIELFLEKTHRKIDGNARAV